MELEILPDRANASCAACGLPSGVQEGYRAQRQGVDGKLLMLCLDFAACCARYRGGLRPGGYAALLREGVRPR